MEVRRIEVSRIVEDPDQPRRAIDDAALAGLADSIRQHDVLNPITVMPLTTVDGFRIVTGERRWRAAQLAGLYDIPCIIRSEDSLEPADKMTEQLIENMQREELSPLDKARAIQGVKDNIGATSREVAQRLGISERTVGHLLDLLDLPESIGEQIISSPNRPADGNLTEKHGRFLKQLNDQPDLQEHLVEKIKNEKLSSDDAGKVARALKSNPEKSEEILESDVAELPRVLGRERDDAPAFSTGRAFIGILERVLPTISEVKVNSVSAGELELVEATVTKIKSVVDNLLAEIRAAVRQTKQGEAG